MSRFNSISCAAYCVLAMSALMTGCGGGGGGGANPPAPTTTYTVGGNASGITATGLVLRNNGGDDLAVNADGAFTFATALADGATYTVTIATLPTGQSCTLDHASGNVAGANITNVTVLCSTLPPPPPSGTLDANFGTAGKALVPISNGSAIAAAIVIQPDGRLVLGGSADDGATYHFALTRHNADGSLDTTFDADGIVEVDTSPNGGDNAAAALALQADGKIVATGSAMNASGQKGFCTVRYNTDGSIDTTFGTGAGLAGVVRTAFGPGATSGASALAIQPDGKIIAAGYTYSTSGTNLALARFNSDGSLDSSFDGDGKVTTGFGTTNASIRAITLQTDGKIVVAGDYYDPSGTDQLEFLLARYNTDGSLDTTFGSAGVFTGHAGWFQDSFAAVAIQPDGKILAAGYTRILTANDFVVARFNDNGTLDSSFGTNGYAVTDINGSDHFDEASSIALQSDGRIVVAGQSDVLGSGAYDFAIVRYNGDGTVDTGYAAQGTAIIDLSADQDKSTAVALQADGKAVVAGYASLTGVYVFAMARLHP